MVYVEHFEQMDQCACQNLIVDLSCTSVLLLSISFRTSALDIRVYYSKHSGQLFLGVIRMFFLISTSSDLRFDVNFVRVQVRFNHSGGECDWNAPQKEECAGIFGNNDCEFYWLIRGRGIWGQKIGYPDAHWGTIDNPPTNSRKLLGWSLWIVRTKDSEWVNLLKLVKSNIVPRF